MKDKQDTTQTKSHIPFQIKPNLEADSLFPPEPKSYYSSPNFSDTYDFPYNPDPLVHSNNYDIYDEMRYDDQVKAALSFKKDLIISQGWEIKCEKQEIVDFLTDNLQNTLDCNFSNALRDMLSALDYGFSLTEPVYKKPIKWLIEIKDFKTRPPHSFYFYLNEKGDPSHIVQKGNAGDIKFEMDYFMHYAYQSEFGSPYGSSDLRAAFQAWKTKKFFLRFWAIYVERFAAPTVIGTYPSTYQADEVQKMLTLLKSFQNATYGVFPEGATIDFKMPNRDSSQIYETGIYSLNMMIARAILMPDLLGMSGEKTSGGSYSLGKTQFNLFMGLIKKEQDALARRITNKVIMPLVRANWGDIQCSFEFKPYSEDDSVEMMKLWIDAVSKKIWTPNPQEVDHAREMIKFPAGPVEIPEPVEPRPFGGGKQGDDEEDDKPTMGKKPPIKEHLNHDLKTYRQINNYEKRIDFSQLKKDMDNAEAKVMPRLRSSGKDIWGDYIDQIKERGIIPRMKPEIMNEIKPRFQKQMNIEFKYWMKDMFKDAYNGAQKELFPNMEATFAVEDMPYPQEFLDLLDAEAFKLVGDYSVEITKKMRSVITQSIKNGEGEVATLKRLRELGDQESDKWLNTVVRTKTSEMYNRGRRSYWDNDEFASQLVEAYEFSAILDDRTSEVCAELDGSIIQKDEDIMANLTPPLHFNCRSVLVPLTKYDNWKEDKNHVKGNDLWTVDEIKEMGGNLI
jgi:SPP1 gp7 family putative phage head morphogenesis protein